MLHRLIGEDISVEVALDPHISPIKADPGQIEQILVNLVINARDAINQKTTLPKEKKITIETSRTVLDKRYVKKHQGSAEGPYACICVSDTGVGMDNLVRDKIFEPFFTTKDKIKGTGLGLSTVYGIVKQNNGYISVYSEEGQGTSIKVYWPESITGTVRKNVEELLKHVEGGDETVLFVEDNEEVRSFTVDALESLGYQVISARNGLEAIEIFEKNNHHIDLLVSDVVMPQMGGKELADAIQKLDPNVRIILTSGYTDHHIMHRGVLTDEINFLHKPYTIEQLASKVRAVLKD
jgi:CheY-like chemotaxis protein